MISIIFEFFNNAFDPLYVDDRCELQKQKDKEGNIIVSLSLVIAFSIAYLVEVVFK